MQSGPYTSNSYGTEVDGAQRLTERVLVQAGPSQLKAALSSQRRTGTHTQPMRRSRVPHQLPWTHPHAVQGVEGKRKRSEGNADGSLLGAWAACHPRMSGMVLGGLTPNMLQHT
jgi:hypothetical protein